MEILILDAVNKPLTPRHMELLGASFVLKKKFQKSFIYFLNSLVG